MSDSRPSFARVEITLRSRGDIIRAATEIQRLAGDLASVAASPDSDEAAHFIALDKIRATSKKLRNPTA
jgi:hypothetical protein